MRARLTVIGFNIAVVSFQLNRLSLMPGGVDVPGFENVLHASSHVSLVLAIPISIAAMIAYIYSSEYDEVGTCSSWTIVAGDLLMYMGLACTIAGFFAPMGDTLDVLYTNANSQSAQLISVAKSLVFLGGISWFMAAYLGPARSIWKSPFPRTTNISLVIGYLALFSYLGYILAGAAAVDARNTTGITLTLWLAEFVQPLRW